MIRGRIVGLVFAAVVLMSTGCRPSEEACEAALDHALDAGVGKGASSAAGYMGTEWRKPLIRKCTQYADMGDMQCIEKARSYAALKRCEFFKTHWDLL